MKRCLNNQYGSSLTFVFKESWHLFFQGTAATAVSTDTLHLYRGRVYKTVVRLVSNFKIRLVENSCPSLFFFFPLLFCLQLYG